MIVEFPSIGWFLMIISACLLAIIGMILLGLWLVYIEIDIIDEDDVININENSYNIINGSAEIDNLKA